MRPWTGIQHDLEPRAAAGRARGGHASAVRFDDGLDDRQPQAAARRALLRTRGVGLVEPIEDERQVLGRDARAGVGDRHDHAAIGEP